MSNYAPKLVTLNLFQGPSCGQAPKPMVERWEPCGERSGLLAKTGRAAKWTLKQVQGDDLVWGAA